MLRARDRARARARVRVGLGLGLAGVQAAGQVGGGEVDHQREER